MEIVNIVKKRSTCLRRQVGAVVVVNKHIVATGYNGVPRNITHCDITGCLRDQLKVPSGERHELCRGLHAEQNAIIQAANYGVSLSGSTIYTNCKPCSICTKMIINAGIAKIIYEEEYNDPLANELLSETNIEIVKLEKIK